MNDLISRQAAIDALQKEINKGIPPFDDVMGSIRCGVRLARNIIEDLPSAQPEPHEGHWIPLHPQILDDAERKYLSAVIRPFRDRVQYIKKIDGACEEYIYIQLNKNWTILPRFKEGTMYKGMEPGHKYTLEELGL